MALESVAKLRKEEEEDSFSLTALLRSDFHTMVDYAVLFAVHLN